MALQVTTMQRCLRYGLPKININSLSHLNVFAVLVTGLVIVLVTYIVILSLVFLLISNLTNGLRLHQFLGTKTTEANKSLKTDANGNH